MSKPIITKINNCQYQAAEVICDEGEIQTWQTQEIYVALAEADAGDFASKDEVDAMRRKWA